VRSQVCYESAFAQHFRRQAAAGGQFILSASNNAHYSPAMPAQHHAQDVMRAMKAIAGLYELPTPAILELLIRQNRVAIST